MSFQSQWSASRRHRRSGRLGQDRADGPVVQIHARHYDIAAITNDIYTKWDAEFLVRSGSLAPGPHRRRRDRRLPAHRDPRGCLDEPRRGRRHAGEISGPRSRADRVRRRQPCRDLLTGACRSHDLCHRRCRWRQDPSKGGPGITRSDLLVINKIDLAPHVGASLEKMRADATRMRGERPFVMTNLKESDGLDRIVAFIEAKGGSESPDSSRALLDAATALPRSLAASGLDG